ncbi:MAG TPA: hypothetical protein VK508_18565 [Cyclobacteriaceae bacterium]|nr:hypothetical protein [Cyclobacteriaceae bacterium]
MKQVSEWINLKWVWILIAFATTLFMHVGIRYYFWDLSAANFNNIVTPLATIASVYLFVRLSLQQQKLAESQSVTPHYERELERIQKLMTHKRGSNVQSEADLFNYLPGAIYGVNQNIHFQLDFNEWKKGNVKSVDYYASQTWFKQQLDIFRPKCFRCRVLTRQ